jgi:hypothetical protein
LPTERDGVQLLNQWLVARHMFENRRPSRRSERGDSPHMIKVTEIIGPESELFRYESGLPNVATQLYVFESLFRRVESDAKENASTFFQLVEENLCERYRKTMDERV